MLRNKGNENENKNGRTAKHIDEITLENQGLEKLLKQDKSDRRDRDTKLFEQAKTFKNRWNSHLYHCFPQHSHKTFLPDLILVI